MGLFSKRKTQKEKDDYFRYGTYRVEAVSGEQTHKYNVTKIEVKDGEVLLTLPAINKNEVVKMVLGEAKAEAEKVHISALRYKEQFAYAWIDADLSAVESEKLITVCK